MLFVMMWKINSSSSSSSMSYILSLIVWVCRHLSNFHDVFRKISYNRVRNGRSRSSKVVDVGTNRKRVCDFLLFINHQQPRNYPDPFQIHCRFLLKQLADVGICHLHHQLSCLEVNNKVHLFCFSSFFSFSFLDLFLINRPVANRLEESYTTLSFCQACVITDFNLIYYIINPLLPGFLCS